LALPFSQAKESLFSFVGQRLLDPMLHFSRGLSRKAIFDPRPVPFPFYGKLGPGRFFLSTVRRYSLLFLVQPFPPLGDQAQKNPPDPLPFSSENASHPFFNGGQGPHTNTRSFFRGRWPLDIFLCLSCPSFFTVGASLFSPPPVLRNFDLVPLFFSPCIAGQPEYFPPRLFPVLAPETFPKFKASSQKGSVSFRASKKGWPFEWVQFF